MLVPKEKFFSIMDSYTIKISIIPFITTYMVQNKFLLTVTLTLLLSNGLVDIKFIASSGSLCGTYKVVPSNVFTSK